jgi:hypothetical protein
MPGNRSLHLVRPHPYCQQAARDPMRISMGSSLAIGCQALGMIDSLKTSRNATSSASHRRELASWRDVQGDPLWRAHTGSCGVHLSSPSTHTTESRRARTRTVRSCGRESDGGSIWWGVAVQGFVCAGGLRSPTTHETSPLSGTEACIQTSTPTSDGMPMGRAGAGVVRRW